MLAIDMLVDECEPTQVRHMLQLIEPRFQRDFISLLPKEVYLLNIFDFCLIIILKYFIIVGFICFVIFGTQRFIKSSPDM